MSAPDWPHCAHGADPTSDPVGCPGRQVEPYVACLAHLADTDRHTYLSTLTPGSDIDHRGTTISPTLLGQLLNSLRDPATGQLGFGDARFDAATFSGDARFDAATFSGDASFFGVTFSGAAGFIGVTFSDNANFDQATFSGDACFSEATFSGDVGFAGATFSDLAWFVKTRFCDSARFVRARFSAGATFGWATFSGDTAFDSATFSDHVGFVQATFERASQLGPMTCERLLSLSGARFCGPVTIEAVATRIECRRTQWVSTAVVRLRYATVDLSDAVLEHPLSITARTAPFIDWRGVAVTEQLLVGTDPRVRIESLRGVDAAHLVLHKVDLSACLLSGTVHLDQLRLEGECHLAPAPSGLRWTARRTLAEEQHWRAAQGQSGWTAAPSGVELVGPAGLAPVYRQMRKSFEDGKNEPDAADFYYGEMEMRRHDRTQPRAERALLGVYWAVSGYGLRASRALGWLLGAMAATVLAMMLWGLPVDDPKPATTGLLTGQNISLTTDRPDPVNPTGPLRSRLTCERWEKSFRIVVNSVIFRSSGQDLTTAGTYTEMASRLAEPVLLGLAALAIRGRVKR
ncbi:pentapeptide repeat-containing protein [Streptomyces sp. NBC_01728]|uniref:pentapeptide repeat-containing protein n=1 Tax=unclassified Streptomyces TaxID=2593676 RepID=UPI002256B2E0|nr:MULTISPECIES: pentapeptide repeat-containing protein [unclassified Streptomyces]MCX4462489.1 pentapeptide repeat-containing protein [Streptomyces sp. NBC_01719]MCX4490049.1 pentapeptide repeat-containing protein [Streptomyces sp. NBC_01728]